MISFIIVLIRCICSPRDYDCNSYHDTYSEYQSGQSVQDAHPITPPLMDKLIQGIHDAKIDDANANANADAATTENVVQPGEVQVEAGDHVNVVTDKGDQPDDAEQILLETSPQQKPTPEADPERGGPHADEVEDKGQPGAEVEAEATGGPAKHEAQKEVKRDVDSVAQEQEDENTESERK